MAGGMGLSTAMRLLRADSKQVVPELGNLLGSVLDMVHDSLDDDCSCKNPPRGSLSSPSSAAAAAGDPAGQALNENENSQQV
jgi:hypothetical protein